MIGPASSLRHRQQAYPDWASALVDRYRRYSTRSLSDVQGRLQRLRDGVTLSVDRPEDFIGYNEVRLSLGRIVLALGCIEARNGYNLRFRSGDEYVITIPRQGNGWISTGDICVEYDFSDIMVIAPLCCVDKHWDGPGEVLSLHIPAERFDVAVARLGIGALPSTPILRIKSRHLRSFLRVLDMICQDLRDCDGPSPFLRAPLSDQTEQMLLTLLLEGVIGDTGAKADVATTSPILPSNVRRAERFIATNAHLPISIVEIAKASGMSIRALQYGFRAFLDATPMQYLKRVRYGRARAVLLLENSNRKISDVAADIGCINVSQFSREYRLLFGETPSETMSGVRRLNS